MLPVCSLDLASDASDASDASGGGGGGGLCDDAPGRAELRSGEEPRPLLLLLTPPTGAPRAPRVSPVGRSVRAAVKRRLRLLHVVVQSSYHKVSRVQVESTVILFTIKI